VGLRFLMNRTTVWLMLQKYGKAAGFDALAIHPHMLRHACGYDLANRGNDTRLIQGFLGHQNIQHTVRYTELAPNEHMRKSHRCSLTFIGVR
jgi:type 1 fimbriae regulatory protein FimB